MRTVVSLVAAILLVVGCRSVEEQSAARRPTVTVNSLVGTSWVAEDIDGLGILARVQSTLTFVSAQQIAGRAACNQYFGSVELVDGTPHLKPAGTTRMACPPAVMEQETRFLNALGAVTTFRFDGVKLLLLDDSGRVRVRMSPMTPGPGASVSVPLQASAFGCAGGPTFVLVRVEGAGRPDGTIDLILAGGRRRLPRVPTASGERYADSGVSVWNKGQEAALDLNGRSYACVENRQRSVIEDARLRGVEFRASGNEPGWIFELFPDRMSFIGGYGTERTMTPRPTPRIGLAPTESEYAALTEAHRLTVRIRVGPCVDSMSGERYESDVEVELDGRYFRGCGEALR